MSDSMTRVSKDLFLSKDGRTRVITLHSMMGESQIEIDLTEVDILIEKLTEWRDEAEGVKRNV